MTSLDEARQYRLLDGRREPQAQRQLCAHRIDQAWRQHDITQAQRR